ncbi:hypothetical protein ACFONG_12410 [Uliginosibacterium paludis]|uniref:Agarase n=1 Tax=Uliginosibacterium paludis TaxID=1615952 RepID=A0ABV2CQB7_9RHOO
MMNRCSLWLVTLALGACASLPRPAPRPAGSLPGTLATRVEVRQRPGGPVSLQTADVLDPARVPRLPADRVDEWGGTLELPAERSSGFFRLQKTGARWWLIDPQGQPFIHVGVVDVRPGTSEAARAAFANRFDSMQTWAQQSAQWLRDQGFNGTGAWSDSTQLGRSGPKLAQARIVNFMSDFAKSQGSTHVVPGHTAYRSDAIPVFDPGFETFANDYARRLSPEADNPAVLGWFSDNELPLGERTLDNFLKLPAGDPNLAAARAWLAARQQRREPDLSAITQEDRLRWAGHVYDTYAGIVSRAIRHADPNHLYLGSRFHGAELRNPHVFEAAGRHLDAISINYYRTWTPDAALMANWAAWSGRPLLITEWYVKGEDSGLPNSTGAGWVVPDQAARGAFYQHFALHLMASRMVVGWHWFRYLDNDPADPKAEPSNLDANKGFFDLAYRPYPALTEAARSVNLHKYALIRALDR